MKVWLVQLEELDERYTAQWARWFPQELENLHIPYEIIKGEKLTSKIESGNVLDTHGTNYYKASQLEQICKLFKDKKIKNGDNFLLYDGWFPGVEMIKYMANMDNINIKVYSIFHAGTYDCYDFTHKVGMDEWAKNLEEHWFNEFYDGIFLATQFHKDLICQNRFIKNQRKLHVTGLPLYPSEFPKFEIEKENLVVFPHRIDDEKQPNLFRDAMKQIQKDYPEWSYIITTEQNLSKEEYYKILAKSKIVVSCALQETWGIGTLEACHYGCIPIVPNRLSYVEIYPWSYLIYDENLYYEIRKIIDNINQININQINEIKKIPMQYENAIKNMIEVIKNDC